MRYGERMHVRDNEPLKAAAHSLLLGCVLPVLAYNVTERKWLNVAVYAFLLGFELRHITGHCRDRVVMTGGVE